MFCKLTLQALCIFAGVLVTAVPGSEYTERDLAPLLKSTGDVIPDSYIVVLNDGVTSKDQERLKYDYGDAIVSSFSGAFKGYTAELDDKSLRQLRSDPNVAYIEQNGIVTINAVDDYIEQKNAPWNLARLSSRKPGSTSYIYHASAGEGTCVYIVDTGVYANHPEFGGRAAQIKSFVNQTTDGNGHGTHLAGIIGGKIYGVAKKTKIYGVKALDDNGSASIGTIIEAMNFVIEDSKGRDCPKGVMMNLSIGGSFSRAMNDAAKAVVNAGIFVSVSAGGSNTDAANSSPASEPTVCTVGGTDRSDARASYSNFGKVVDIFAPGTNIISASIRGGTVSLSGTSMSAAHITGMGAYIAGKEGFPGAEQLCKRLQDLATRDILTRIPQGTANLLVFNGNPSG